MSLIKMLTTAESITNHPERLRTTLGLTPTPEVLKLVSDFKKKLLNAEDKQLQNAFKFEFVNWSKDPELVQNLDLDFLSSVERELNLKAVRETQLFNFLRESGFDLSKEEINSSSKKSAQSLLQKMRKCHGKLK